MVRRASFQTRHLRCISAAKSRDHCMYHGSSSAACSGGNIMSANAAAVSGLTPAPTSSTTTPTTGSGAPAASGTATGGSTSNSGSNTNTSSAHDIIITEWIMSNTSWPVDLHLNLAKSNWKEWSFQLQIQTDRLGFTKWLKGTLPCPCVTKYPKAHDIWETNDCSLRAFIFGRISLSDFIAVEPLATSYLIFEELRLRHEKLGMHTQLLMIKKVLDYHYDPKAPLCQGAEHILVLHNKITKMGPVDFNQLKIIFLINAFGDRFDTVQSSILSAMDSPTFSANTILHHFNQEDSISCAHVVQGGHNSTALLAMCWDKPPCIYSNCKKEGHLAEYCIQPGRGLAGKTIEEARNAQRAASGRRGIWGGQCSQAGTTASANIVTAPIVPSDSSESITINGRTFILAPKLPNATGNMQPSVNLVEVSNEDIACAMHKDDLFEYSAYLCENGSSHISIDWSTH